MGTLFKTESDKSSSSGSGWGWRWFWFLLLFPIPFGPWWLTVLGIGLFVVLTVLFPPELGNSK